jgi:hypothetical protein
MPNAAAQHHAATLRPGHALHARRHRIATTAIHAQLMHAIPIHAAVLLSRQVRLAPEATAAVPRAIQLSATQITILTAGPGQHAQAQAGNTRYRTMETYAVGMHAWNAQTGYAIRLTAADAQTDRHAAQGRASAHALTNALQAHIHAAGQTGFPAATMTLTHALSSAAPQHVQTTSAQNLHALPECAERRMYFQG